MSLLNWLRGGKKKEEPKSKLFPKPVRQDNGFYPRERLTYSQSGLSEPDPDSSNSLLTGIMVGEMLSQNDNSDNAPTIQDEPQFNGFGGGDMGGGGSGGSYDTPDTSSTDTSSSDNYSGSSDRSSYDSSSSDSGSSYDSSSSDSSSSSDY